MTIGPLQLILVKFADEQRTRPISQELKAVRKDGVIRLVDMLYIYKDPNGALQSKQFSDLAEAEKAQYGVLLKGLLGMRAAYKTGGDVDKIAEAMSLTPGDFGLTSEQVQKMAEGVPNGGSAMLILFEHVWAVKLKESLLNAGGEVIAQGLLSPDTLAVGGVTLEEATAAAKRIEDEAEQIAAAAEAEKQQKLADADVAAAAALAAAAAAAEARLSEADAEVQAKLEQIDADAAAKLAEAEARLAEAQKTLEQAEAEANARLEQAKIVAAAAIAASVRTAAGEMEKADKQLEQSKLEAEARIAESEEIAAQTVQAGEAIAQQTIEQGVQTAEQIKSAAVIEALKILVEAQVIKREATQQAINALGSASMIEPASAQVSLASLLRPVQ